MKNNAEKAFTKALWLTIAIHVTIWAWAVFFSFSRSAIPVDLGGDVLELVDAGATQKKSSAEGKEVKLLVGMEPETLALEEKLNVSPTEVVPEPIAPSAKEVVKIPEALPIVKKEPIKKATAKKPEKKPPPKLEQVSYEKFLQKYGKKINTKTSSTPKKQIKKSTATSTLVHPKISISGVVGGQKNTKGKNSAQAVVGKIQGIGPGNGSALSQYISNIRSHIEEAWANQEIVTQGILRATVCFKVTEYGKISDCRIVTPSKDPNFDRILLVLFGQLPLMPPPDNASHNFQLTFEQGD